MTEMFEPGEFPKPGDTLFKGSNSIRDAYLDWWDDREYALIGSYKRAADHLTELAVKENYHPEDHFFPASFLYRHWLELCLKRLIKEGSLALTGKAEVATGHDLAILWDKLAELLPQFWPDLASEAAEAAAVVVKELDTVDKPGTEFRYATHRNGEATLGNAPKRVSMPNLYEVMKRLEFFLTCCGEGIWMLTHKDEMESERS